MQHSETFQELFKALIAAQAQIKPAKKSATNSHLRNRYATLSDVWEALHPALAANSLAVLAFPTFEGNSVSTTIKIIHSSGEWISHTVTIPVERAGAQAVGSALTYAKRYALTNIFCISADEDDDGNAASGLTQQKPVQRTQPAQQPQRPATRPVAQNTRPQTAQSAL